MIKYNSCDSSCENFIQIFIRMSILQQQALNCNVYRKRETKTQR